MRDRVGNPPTFTSYPAQTCNRNVPKGTYLIFEATYTSGEITNTYYVDAQGYIWSVCDWVGSKPQPVTMSEACRLTGDTERMITGRFESAKAHGLLTA